MNYTVIENFLNHNRNPLGAPTLDEKSNKIAIKIIELLNTLEPMGNDGKREIWIKVPRGRINDILDYNDLLECEVITNKEEYYDYFNENYENEKWYKIISFDYYVGNKQYQSLLINGTPLYVSDYPIKDTPIDITKVLNLLYKKTLDTVEMINQEYEDTNAYDEMLNKSLPGKYRYGLLSRKTAYKMCPNIKISEFKDLTFTEIMTFLNNLYTGKITKIKDMTASDFYNYCYTMYKANGYKLDNLTPKEAYLRYSDGRDDGLTKINDNNPVAFKQWLINHERGGHPWEVIRGGNSTHVNLYVLYNEESEDYTLVLDGKYRTKEIVKSLNGLQETGICPDLNDSKLFDDRFRGFGYYGIIPDDQIPRYQESNFNFPIDDFINYRDIEEVGLQDEVAFYPLPKHKIMKTNTKKK